MMMASSLDIGNCSFLRASFIVLEKSVRSHIRGDTPDRWSPYYRYETYFVSSNAIFRLHTLISCPLRGFVPSDVYCTEAEIIVRVMHASAILRDGRSRISHLCAGGARSPKTRQILRNFEIFKMYDSSFRRSRRHFTSKQSDSRHDLHPHA